MILRNYNPCISYKEFKRVIKDLLMEGQNPCLEQSGTEVTIWYNHPKLSKRLCHRMGLFTNQKSAITFANRIWDILEVTKVECGL